MRRDIEGRLRTTLVLLLFAGCAERDPESGFSATQPTSSVSDGTTTASTDTSTGATSTADTTGAVSATTSDSTTGPTTGADGTSGSGAVESSGSDETGSTDTASTGEDTAPSYPSFAVDVYPLIDAHCACHEDDQGAGMLRLRQEDAYTNMVDQPSKQLPAMMLVAPGAAESSYLWHKLNDNQEQVGGTGKRMPSGGMLGMDDLALIQLWIEEGAKP
ncbi:MAG: hypothetical protein H0T76_10890 [Nannocystis sp.]|nr:hypothetical protein [Nannocystis sp.]MBA3546979.1 hypothetical protein [Nannocystis sp.]